MSDHHDSTTGRRVWCVQHGVTSQHTGTCYATVYSCPGARLNRRFAYYHTDGSTDSDGSPTYLDGVTDTDGQYGYLFTQERTTDLGCIHKYAFDHYGRESDATVFCGHMIWLYMQMTAGKLNFFDKTTRSSTVEHNAVTSWSEADGAAYTVFSKFGTAAVDACIDWVAQNRSKYIGYGEYYDLDDGNQAIAWFDVKPATGYAKLQKNNKHADWA